MSRPRISSDAEADRQEVGRPRRPSALRGFIGDIAVLFAIMVGRDMVQRPRRPRRTASAEPTQHIGRTDLDR